MSTATHEQGISLGAALAASLGWQFVALLERASFLDRLTDALVSAEAGAGRLVVIGVLNIWCTSFVILGRGALAGLVCAGVFA